MSRFRPHPSLKQELTSDQQKIRSFIIIGVLTVLVGVVAGVLYWLFFSNHNYSTASLAPIDSEMYMKMEWRESSEQNTNLNNLSLNLGGATTIDDFLKLLIPEKFGNTKTTFKDDIAPWVSDDVAIVRRHIANSNEDVKMFVASDKDKKQAFLNKIVSEADTTAKENYKGYQIQSLFGAAPVSFAEVGNTVIFGAKPQVLHDVLDVAAGDAKSLTKAEDFNVTQKHIDKNVLISAFMDVSPYFKNPEKFGLSPDLGVVLNGQARVGITFAAKQTGFGLQIFAPKKKTNDAPKNNFNNDILTITPNSIAGYLGATNVSDLLNQYLTTIFTNEKLKSKGITQDTIQSKYGVDINKDLLDWSKGQYAVISLAEHSNQFAFVVKVDNKDQVAASMKKVEKAIAGIVKELSAEPEKIPAEFSESDGVRYLPIGGAANYYLNYAFKDNFLVFATSREALDKILKPATDQPNLLKSKQYELVTKELPEGDGSGVLYIQGTMFIDFLKSLGYDFGEYNRHVVGLGLKTVNVEEGKMITGFLPIL